MNLLQKFVVFVLLCTLVVLGSIIVSGFAKAQQASEAPVTITITPQEQSATLGVMWDCLDKKPFACADFAAWYRNKLNEAQKAATPAAPAAKKE